MLTDSLVLVSQAVFDILNDGMKDLGVKAVYYGDQDRILYNPTVCVESGLKERALNGIPRRTQVTFTVHLRIYHNPISVDNEKTRLANDTLDEAVEALLHEWKNYKLGGLVIDSMVESIEPGYQIKVGSVQRASQLIYKATSQVLLPSVDNQTP
jgi:hypothetical protein